MALAIVVLLPTSYIASYWSAAWFLGRGDISLPTWNRMQDTVFAPLHLYMNADLSGSREIDAIAQTLYESGDAVMLPW